MGDESFWSRINQPAELRQVRWMAVICFASGSLLVFGAFFPFRDIPDIARQWVAIGLTLGAGAVYWLLAPWFRVWMLHTIVSMGFVWGLLRLATVDSPVAAAMTLSTLLWTCVYVGSTFPSRVARIYGAGLWVGLSVAIKVSGIDGGVNLAIAFGASFLVTMEILSRAMTTLRNQASSDPLTGLLNRNGLAQAAQPTIAGAAAGRYSVALLHIDLDEFKAVNDRGGHLAGDRVLKSLADAWRSVSRDGDLFARIGGDEFVAVFRGVDQEEAEAMVERLRAVSPVDWSSGLCMVGPGDDLERCLARTDIQLYEEKAAKNQRVDKRTSGGPTWQDAT